MTCMPYVDSHFSRNVLEEAILGFGSFRAMETTHTPTLYSRETRRGDFMNTDTEAGLKETAHNLVGDFNNEAKANYQESPAVFTVEEQVL